MSGDSRILKRVEVPCTLCFKTDHLNPEQTHALFEMIRDKTFNVSPFITFEARVTLYYSDGAFEGIRMPALALATGAPQPVP